MPLTSQEKAELFACAEQAMHRAYSPYSNFSVGAAVRCADGTLFGGCNIENASYGATICAERSALAAAVSAGKRDFTDIAIISSGAELSYPCGICLQVISELAPQASIHLFKKGGDEKTLAAKEVLPLAFHLNDCT